MKKILAIALILVLALGMTTVAFAEDTKGGTAGLTWTPSGDTGPGTMVTTPVPVGYEAFSNPNFDFGTQEMSYDQDKTYTSQRAGVIIAGNSTGWTLTARITGFYKADDTARTGTQYMKGTTLTLNSPTNKLGDGAAFTLTPQAGKALSPLADGTFGAAQQLAKGRAGLFGINWVGSLKVLAGSQKIEDAVSATVEWALTAGA